MHLDPELAVLPEVRTPRVPADPLLLSTRGVLAEADQRDDVVDALVAHLRVDAARLRPEFVRGCNAASDGPSLEDLLLHRICTRD